MSNEITGNRNKGFFQYFDILVASMNFLVILITFIIFQKNIFISLFGILFSGVLIVITIYTFIRNNPFYTHYFVGLLISGFFFTIPLILRSSWLGFLFYLDILFFYRIYRSYVHQSAVTTRSKAKVMGWAGSMGLDIKNLRQGRDNLNLELRKKRNQIKESLEKQYNGNSLLRNSLILSLSLIIIFILHLQV